MKRQTVPSFVTFWKLSPPTGSWISLRCFCNMKWQMSSWNNSGTKTKWYARVPRYTSSDVTFFRTRWLIEKCLDAKSCRMFLTGRHVSSHQTRRTSFEQHRHDYRSISVYKSEWCHWTILEKLEYRCSRNVGRFRRRDRIQLPVCVDNHLELFRDHFLSSTRDYFPERDCEISRLISNFRRPSSQNDLGAVHRWPSKEQLPRSERRLKRFQFSKRKKVLVFLVL